jgi:hypothetical protein
MAQQSKPSPVSSSRPSQIKIEKKNTVQNTYSFSRINYQLMIIGLVIIAIGFILMSGSEDIFSTMKMTVAPIVVILGFGFEIYAILKRQAGE